VEEATCDVSARLHLSLLLKLRLSLLLSLRRSLLLRRCESLLLRLRQSLSLRLRQCSVCATRLRRCAEAGFCIFSGNI
jgi:hypothetical protein